MMVPAVAVSDAAPGRSSARRIKVLHIITGDIYAGAERVQELLANRLPEFGYEVSFACLKEGEFQQRLSSGRLDVGTFAMRSRFDLFRTTLQILNRLRGDDVRLIHTHTVRGALVGSIVATMSGLPMVHHIHSPTARDTTDGLGNRVNSLVERMSLKRAGMLIPVSESLAQYLETQGHAARRVRTVCNGVPVGALRDAMASGAAPVLGMVALFRPRKGIEVLLHAMALLNEQGQPVRLHAVGTFESRDHEQRVRALAGRLGVSDLIDWRGFRSDVLAELERMDVLVLPSLFGEGLPMVMLEAMAVGLPVVASAVEGIPEAIREGQEGFLVPPDDPLALAAALTRLADNPGRARGMGIAGRNRQRKVFSDEAMARQVSRVYDGMLGRGG